MAAEVTGTGAVIWARTDQDARMTVALRAGDRHAEIAVPVTIATDFTGQARFDDLQPGTTYTYTVRFDNAGAERGSAVEGAFRTAPPPAAPAAVRIAWTGDIAGQNVCRDVREGFPVFRAIKAEGADLFIGLGDMIYADDTCGAVGRYGNPQVPGDFPPADDLASFRAHWRYNRADPHFQALVRTVPYYGVWDDHEVLNDFGPLHDTRAEAPQRRLMPIGLRAFLDYTPLLTDPQTPDRLYRSVRWGRHAEIFFLDNRQYRDHNQAPDREGRHKTMLGREQLTWLKRRLHASDATWKIIVSSVPMSVPTGFPPERGRDGFANHDANPAPTLDNLPQSATGFEGELREILGTLQAGAMQAVFITTDVHFAEVFRYTPFPETPGFRVHEVVVGPGNAGVFPNRAFDTTFGTESLFFHGPETPAAITSWDEAKQWFNYGTLDIDSRGRLVVRVMDATGKTLYTLDLAP